MYCCRRVGVSICTFVPVKQVNLGFTWITNNVSIPVYPPVMPGPDAEHPLACVGPGSIVSLKGLPPISTPSYKEETKYMPACAGLQYFSLRPHALVAGAPLLLSHSTCRCSSSSTFSSTAVPLSQISGANRTKVVQPRACRHIFRLFLI